MISVSQDGEVRSLDGQRNRNYHEDTDDYVIVLWRLYAAGSSIGPKLGH